MSVNYAQLAADAYTLVKDAGRMCTFVELRQTPADPTKPWAGAADPRVNPVQSVSLPAVSVDVGTIRTLGISSVSEDLLKRASEFYIVAPGAKFTGDLLKCHEVVDGSSRFSIVFAAELRPGTKTVIYYVGVER